MADVLTLAEMKTRYAGQWVLVADPVTDAGLEVQSGRVLFASPDRDAVYRSAIEARPARFAVVYTGPMSSDVVLAL